VDAGQGPAPCTPGIVAGESDSISFEVSPVSGIVEFINQDEVFVFPNPATEQINIKGLELHLYPVLIELFSQDGKLSKKILLGKPDDYIEIHELPVGVYQIAVETRQGIKYLIPLVKQ
jgi:hypothetical protein